MSRRRTGNPLRELPAEVRALVVVGFFVALGYAVVAPAIPLFAREFGVSKTAAAAVISAFALMRLATAPFTGRLVDVLGERVLLASGIAVVAASSLLAGFSQAYWQLIVLRGIGGVGSIMFSVSAAQILIRVTPGHLRGRAQGAWAGSFLLGMIAGPAVGSVAAFSLRAPFFLYAGTLVVAGTMALYTLRHSAFASRQARDTATPPLALRAALRQRAYVAALIAGFAGDFAIVGTRSAIVPQYVPDRLHLGSAWVYVAFLVTSVVSGALLFPFGHVADTSGRRAVMLGGLATGAVGFALIPALPVTGGLLLGMALLGVAGAADSVAPGAVVGDVVVRRGGTVVAAFQMAGDIGAVLGPLAAGWVADAHGYTATFLISALVVLLPLPFVAGAPETLVRAGAGEAAGEHTPGAIVGSSDDSGACDGVHRPDAAGADGAAR